MTDRLQFRSKVRQFMSDFCRQIEELVSSDETCDEYKLHHLNDGGFQLRDACWSFRLDNEPGEPAKLNVYLYEQMNDERPEETTFGFRESGDGSMRVFEEFQFRKTFNPAELAKHTVKQLKLVSGITPPRPRLKELPSVKEILDSKRAKTDRLP
jgi:hypothetical protein